MDIYEQAVNSMQGNEIDHHQSDLYLKVNDVSKELVNRYEFKSYISAYVSGRCKLTLNHWKRKVIFHQASQYNLKNVSWENDALFAKQCQASGVKTVLPVIVLK